MARAAGETDSVRIQDLDNGRLAGAVRSEQRDDLAAADVEVDAIEDGRLAVRLAQTRHCAASSTNAVVSPCSNPALGARSRRYAPVDFDVWEMTP
jgi:hypothetical protein